MNYKTLAKGFTQIKQEVEKNTDVDKMVDFVKTNTNRYKVINYIKYGPYANQAMKLIANVKVMKELLNNDRVLYLFLEDEQLWKFLNQNSLQPTLSEVLFKHNIFELALSLSQIALLRAATIYLAHIKCCVEDSKNNIEDELSHVTSLKPLYDLLYENKIDTLSKQELQEAVKEALNSNNDSMSYLEILKQLVKTPKGKQLAEYFCLMGEKDFYKIKFPDITFEPVHFFKQKTKGPTKIELTSNTTAKLDFTYPGDNSNTYGIIYYEGDISSVVIDYSFSTESCCDPVRIYVGHNKVYDSRGRREGTIKVDRNKIDVINKFIKITYSTDCCVSNGGWGHFNIKLL